MTTTTTEKKLARALRACLEVLDDLPPCAAAGHAAKLGHEALAAHEADKQRESVDEREAFEAWVEREAGPGADQDNRAGWVACLNWQAGRASAQAVPAWQPIETAPKDGRKLILSYKNSHGLVRTVMAKWVTDEEAAETDTDDVGLEGGWYECIDNWDDYCQVAIHQGEPTHWMPLPAAPKGD